MSEPYWSTLGGAAIDYEGAWDVGKQYAAGDIVRYAGVDFLAVNPSLGVAPGATGVGAVMGCKLTRTVDLAITVGVWTLIPWDAEDFDTHDFHSTTSLSGRITIPTGCAGNYQVACTLEHIANAPNNTLSQGMAMDIRRNGTDVGHDGTSIGVTDTKPYVAGFGNTLHGMTDFVALVPGDTLRCWFFSQGSTPSVRGTTSKLSIRRMEAA